VVSPIAEITTTISWPCCFVATLVLATRLMLSAPATEEPPYFCTTRPTPAPVPRRESSGVRSAIDLCLNVPQRILGIVNEPSTPEPEPPEAPHHQPAEETKRPIEPRIGDADRDQAVAFLQEHMAQGRIDAAEFDDRMSRALKAKTASELAVLFEDLPDPRPSSATNP